MIFSDSPQQRALERMMTAVPRFLPQGGGIMVLHRFEYTAEMCDCRYCPYYRGKRKFSILKDRFANLDELNYLAKRMESFDYHEYDQFLIGITKLQNPTEKDLINLTFNLDHFTLCKDVSSYGKIGREIEYQNGRANIKTTSINILKGFFACSLIGVVPVELYKFCISLQNTFAHDLTSMVAGGQSLDLAGQSTSVLEGSFAVSTQVTFGLLNLLCLIAFAYCVIKIFFQNIKRGGILLVQMAVGSLYMFSVPRGYTDGFNQWCKQVAAICLTAFMQTTLLFLGLLTFPDHMLLGLGIMLAANEVPRIAQQFGLDSSVKVNMMSVVHATTTAVNLTRSVARATGK